MTTAADRRRARLVYPRPISAAWSTPRAAAAIAEFVDGGADLIYVLRSYLAPLAEPWLADDRRTPVVVDVDEDDPRAFRQLADLHRRAGEADEAEMADADADKLDALVTEWLGQADLVLAASADEVARLQARVPAVTTRVLPNPVPVRFDDGTAEAVDLLFVANFGYLPNQDAARWLCHEVLPALRRRMGRAVRVALAGSSMGAAVLTLKDTDVIVIRSPHSVTPMYEATTIAVAPLRAGGGTRLKILEAFGHRRAVVATSQGAEGLPVESGTHLLIADGAEEFAAACAQLLLDPNLRRSLVRAGVEVAMAHSWSRVATTVSEIALSVVAGTPG
jgi:glycosyltransferase involved in cell wall biosynthesis